MLVSIRSDDQTCSVHGPLASLPPTERRVLPCALCTELWEDSLVSYFRYGFMFLIKQVLVTIQQFILLGPHNMPCITIILNTEKILVWWVIPRWWCVSTAVNSTHCKPKNCDMSKEPLPTSPLKAECLPPRRCLQSLEVVAPSAHRSHGQLLSAPPLIVVLWLYSLSCDGGPIMVLNMAKLRS